jgi:hypothetical protein
LRESKGFPKKKKKPDSISKRKDKVWKWFSIYIRLRDADWRGYVSCVTCGAVKYWKLGDAGHFIPGRHNSILFDERNVHFQCKRCNGPLKSNPRKYQAYMLKRYGQEVIDELDRLDAEMKQFERPELDRLYTHYQKLATTLMKEKG